MRRQPGAKPPSHRASDPMRGVRLLAAGVLALVAVGSAFGAGDAPLQVVDAGPYRIAVMPAGTLPPLRVLGVGVAQRFEGRRGVDVILSGESPEPAVPALGSRIKVKSDTGEELELEWPPGETTRAPDGRHFVTRYRLDCSRLIQPAREIRLAGEVWSQRPPQANRKRVELSLGEALAPLELGPLRLSGSPGRAADAGPSFTARIEWNVPDDAPDLLPIGGDVTGPVEAELVLADGAPCRLAQVVSVDTTVAGGMRRTQTFMWRVPESGHGELRISYLSAPRETTRFAIDRVPLPPPLPPALGRIGAQRMALEGPDALLEALDLLEPEGPQGDAPHPLLDAAHGGALRFRLRLPNGTTAASGTIDAALSPRSGGGWGGWHWFTGRTDVRGEATLANVKPGTYRLRIHFRTAGAASRDCVSAEPEVTVRAGERLQLPVFDLRPRREARAQRPK